MDDLIGLFVYLPFWLVYLTGLGFVFVCSRLIIP